MTENQEALVNADTAVVQSVESIPEKKEGKKVRKAVMAAEIASSDATPTAETMATKQDGVKRVRFKMSNWMELSDETLAQSAVAMTRGFGRCDEESFILRFYGFITDEDLRLVLKDGDVEEYKYGVMARFFERQLKEHQPMRINFRIIGLDVNNADYGPLHATYDIKDIVKTSFKAAKYLVPALEEILTLKEKEIKSGSASDRTGKALSKNSDMAKKLLARIDVFREVLRKDRPGIQDIRVQCESLSFLAPGFKPSTWASVRL